MPELPFGQLAAGYIAVLLAFVCSMALVRSRARVTLLAIGLLAAVPLVGFVAYTVVPGPRPNFDGPLLDVALAGALVAFAAGVALVLTSVTRRGSLEAGTLRTLLLATAALWLGLVVALSAFLAQWQPVYAGVDLVLNAAWAAVWIPRRTRRLRGAWSVDVAAPRERVYDFMSRPENTPLYDGDVVSVSVNPPGPVAVGSEIAVRRRYDSMVRGPRILPGTVESRSVVTSIVPGQSFTTRLMDRGTEGVRTLEFADAQNGTRVTMRSTATVGYAAGLLGFVVDAMLRWRTHQANAALGAERLKKVLEADSPPV